MSGESLSSFGKKMDDIDVAINYKIVDLFSDGLYTSPNKAVEELVANSFDAGAKRAHVFISPDIETNKDASIVVIDDGSGMGPDELKGHWRIGYSDKRAHEQPPHGRPQIGKFGIGKLATYVLARQFTHISKHGGQYFMASMDYDSMNRHESQVLPSDPVKIPLHELTSSEAERAVEQYTQSFELEKSDVRLFGEGGPTSWTICVMSNLKPRASEIKMGRVGWILRTALALHHDFDIWLNGKKIKPSQLDENMILKRVIGKDLVDLPTPAPETTVDSDGSAGEHAHGLRIRDVGRVTGYVEAYKHPLQQRSDQNRICGFFVYVRGRLVNLDDGHFGISANELRHGTFSRFRAVVHMDYLDGGLRSTREAIADGHELRTSRCLLRAIFNYVRSRIEEHDQTADPASRLARRLTAGRSSLSRKPLASLARSVAEGKVKARHITVPEHESVRQMEEFLSKLEARMESPDGFVTKIEFDYKHTGDPIAVFHTETMVLEINECHPFVSAFHDEFAHPNHGQPLGLLAMAEILSEAHMHYEGIERAKCERVLDDRDSLLRNLANDSGHQSPFSIANDLSDELDPKKLEELVCASFKSLGFEVMQLGKQNEPDGVATAVLPADENGDPQGYKVSLEAKSKKSGNTTVSAHSVDVSGIDRHARKHKCDHIVVVAPAFPTSRQNSALEQEIRRSMEQKQTDGKTPTFTLITIKDLAELVRQRPIKLLRLKDIRELFERCVLPDQCAAWVKAVKDRDVESPNFRRILKTINVLAQEFAKEPVKYPSLRTKLSNLDPPVKYPTDGELMDVCKAMAQMSRGAVWADDSRVELDQSVENAIVFIEKSVQEHGGTERDVSVRDG